MTRTTLLALLLTGCPAALESEARIADCCQPSDGGLCEWVAYRYTVPRFTEPLADDARACRQAGLEPYGR